MFLNLEAERDQIWAEAVVRFKAGEPLYLEGKVSEKAEEEQRARLIVDPWENIIFEYIDRKIPSDWFEKTMEAQKNYWLFANNDGENLTERDRICASEILYVCLRNRA